VNQGCKNNVFDLLRAEFVCPINLVDSKRVNEVLFSQKISINRFNCLCGNTTKYTATSLTSCYAPCSGDSGEICGDNNLLFSVYASSKICFAYFLGESFLKFIVHLKKKTKKESNVTTTIAPRTTTPPCQDIAFYSGSCAYFSKRGYCSKNNAFLDGNIPFSTACKKTCNKC